MPEPIGAPASRSRSIAWIWYALLAIGAVIAGFSHPVLFLVAMLFALYSRYLFRGGSFVIWIW